MALRSVFGSEACRAGGKQIAVGSSNIIRETCRLELFSQFYNFYEYNNCTVSTKIITGTCCLRMKGCAKRLPMQY
eukprot:5469707-Amphidinium_carterae.1